MNTRYSRRAKIWVAWLPLVILPALVITLTPTSVPPWALMWLLSATIFYAFKYLSWESNCRPASTKRRQVAWWFAWVGMDPARFLSQEQLPSSQRPKIGEWLRSVTIAVLGATLFFLGIILVRRQSDAVAAWCGMFGMVLMLHFGLFHLISCAWRAVGVSAQPIMNRPLLSACTGEFWGRRWNRAFRDASYGALFVPIARRWGALAATWAVFVFSGLIHELAVSVPAQGGYGLPTLYFLLQCVAVLLENSEPGKRWGLGHGRWGRAITLAIVFLPLPILFHPPFVRNVIVPFLQWAASI